LQQAPASVSQILDHLADLSKSPGETLALVRSAAAALVRRNGVERLVPIGVCVLLLGAAFGSSMAQASPGSAAASPTGGAQLVAAAPVVWYGQGDGPNAADVSDIYLGDGTIPNTLQNPGVGTDASSLLQTYSVQAGDTLGLIAGRFGLATGTIYWANKATLPNPSSLRVGQQLLIPPMDGLLVKVGAKDKLDSLAAKYKVATQDIIDANNLPEATIAIGQTLLIPGASGGPVPKVSTPSSRGWIWPVQGTYEISQYFWSGHHAIDIAASMGTPVVAAASGTVVFAGWRSTIGGGYVVWIKHGTKLYSTYNHLSYVYAKVGQHVSAGTRVGLVGMSGVATGPHLHFEVWLGYPWALGTTADAVNPCAYLAGC
jgi:murein DD-endopeptidase MepM/ murein hydrolase activator NlpD